jgi:TRAP-type uncharacterized transport system fused permease subunit
MGAAGMVILRVVSSFVGLGSMAVTFHGYLFRNLNWIERVLFLIGGLALVFPHVASSLFGYALIGVLVLRQILSLRPQKVVPLAAEKEGEDR